MKNIFDVLKHHYGYDTFRPGQQEVIEAILKGEDVLAVMPTGEGNLFAIRFPRLLWMA